MGAVRPAESVAGLAPQPVVDGCEVAGRQDDVGVEDEQVFAARTGGSEVARRAWAGIGLDMIADVEAVAVTLHDVGAGHARPVFDHDDLKVGHGLSTEARQQFVDLVGAVIHGDEYGVFHTSSVFVFLWVLCKCTEKKPSARLCPAKREVPPSVAAHGDWPRRAVVWKEATPPRQTPAPRLERETGPLETVSR